MSGTERRVWYRLRGRRLAGFKFRRQLPIGSYFADFVCLSARLVVEIDGGEHHEIDSDRCKTAYLESQGFRVVRIPACCTDQGLDEVMESILCELFTSPLAKEVGGEAAGWSRAPGAARPGLNTQG